MKLIADRKLFRASLDTLAGLVGGLVGDSSGGDILLTVTKKGKCTLEAGGEGKYVYMRLPTAAIGDASQPGRMVFTAQILRQLRTSGDVVELELDSRQRIKFKCGKMIGYVEALDDEVGDSIREEKPPKSEMPDMVKVPTIAFALAVNAVNFAPAIHSAEDDVFINMSDGFVRVVMNDSVRGAIAVISADSDAELKFALPPSILVHIVSRFTENDHILMGISDDNQLYVQTPNKDLLVVHPLSVNDEPDEDVEAMIDEVRQGKKTVAFKANIGEVLSACKHVVSVVPGGMAVDTKMEIQLGSAASKVVMRSSVGRMRHEFPIKRMTKASKKKGKGLEIFISGKFFMEFLEMIGDKEEGFKTEVIEDTCIIEALDVNRKAGEKVIYIMPLIEN